MQKYQVGGGGGGGGGGTGEFLFYKTETSMLSSKNVCIVQKNES